MKNARGAAAGRGLFKMLVAAFLAAQLIGAAQLTSTENMAFAASTTDPSRLYFGARPLSLGNAFVAVGSDANSIFINPAGCATLANPQFVGTSRPLFFEETLYSAGGYAYPTSWGTFGFGIVDAAAATSLPTTRDPATNRITIDASREATDYDNNVVLLTYAKKLSKDFSMGANLKLFNQSISGGAGLSGTNLNADLGVLYQPFYIPWLTLGAAYQNALGGSIRWNNGTSDQLGSTLKLGSAINILGEGSSALYKIPEQKLLMTIDFDSIGADTLSDQTSDLKIGFEYSPLKISNLNLRLGYDANLGTGFGVGYERSGFRFDYAYFQNSAVAGNNPHYFSIAYSNNLPATSHPRTGSKNEPLEYKFPYVRIDSPKDKLLTPEPSLLLKGVAREINKKGYWVITQEAQTTNGSSESGFSENPIGWSSVEVFIPVSIEAHPINNLADLKLNGQSMPFNKNGHFETNLRLDQGFNLITVEAVATAEVVVASKNVRVLKYSPFNDVAEDYWARDPIAYISTFKIITGYPDDTFKPENPITRAELVTLLMKAKGGGFSGSPEAAFKDVKAGHWAEPYIYQAANQGIVKGYSDLTFRPTQNLTRAEGVAILARWAELQPGRDLELVPFPDLAENYWANDFIRQAKSAGMLKYLDKQNFDPKMQFTRVEAAEVLLRTPFIQEKVDRLWDRGEMFAP